MKRVRQPSDYQDGRSKAWPGGPTIAARRREIALGEEFERCFGPSQPGRRAGKAYLDMPPELFPRSWQHKVEKWAKKYPRIDLVLLYGSRARGDGREDSDVDLAVLFTEDAGDTAAGLSVARGKHMAADLQSVFSISVDVRCVQHPGASRDWLASVKRDGLIVYRAKMPIMSAGQKLDAK